MAIGIAGVRFSRNLIRINEWIIHKNCFKEALELLRDAKPLLESLKERGGRKEEAKEVAKEMIDTFYPKTTNAEILNNLESKMKEEDVKDEPETDSDPGKEEAEPEDDKKEGKEPKAEAEVPALTP